jgi:hypothetical protein
MKKAVKKKTAKRKKFPAKQGKLKVDEGYNNLRVAEAVV